MIPFQIRRPRILVLSGVIGALTPLVAALQVGATPNNTPPKPSVNKPGAAQPAHPLASGKLHYNQDILPILAENCFTCHGPDSAARKADLRLDRPEDSTALHNGITPIVKGKPEASEVVKRITASGPLQMPPAYTHKQLKPAQIAVLKRWIAQGAEYEVHWSYITPKLPALPAVKNTAWVRNPIDRFVLARLEKEGLKPAPEADRRTLARRLSLDLTGLPPDPADVEKYVNDHTPNAYEKLVDTYLASPRYGEHRSRYWLDAARYADTNGIHFDNYREIWSYRDWVINAYNQNKPFDQFTLEQLAGDLLPNPTLDQLVATGFVRCNITTNEGGAIAEEYKVLYARDRTETATQVWMGSTLGCAVCHDHKFDPFKQKDFYSFSAFFNNTTQEAMDGNVKDTPPIIPVPMPQDRPRFEALKGELTAARQAVDTRKASAQADFDKWFAGAKAETVAATMPQAGLRFSAPLSEGQGRTIQAVYNGTPMNLTASSDPGWDAGQTAAHAFQRKAGSVVEAAQVGDFDNNQSFTYAAWIKLPASGGNGAVFARMDDQHDYRGWDLWMENSKIGTHIINKWPDDALKVATMDPISTGQWHHVCVVYPGTMKAADVRVYVDGMQKPTQILNNNLKSTIKTTVPFKIGQRNTTAGVDGVDIQDIRLYDRAMDSNDVARLAGSTRAAWLVARGTPLTAAEKDETFRWWLNAMDTEYATSNQKLAALETENNAILQRGTVAHIEHEKPGMASAFVLNRGEYDQHRDPVTAATPASLLPMPADFPKNRLGLAKWLLLPENPLTARVTVNRYWQEVFGAGLVRTAGDYGVNGEMPSHPELLDWLAVDFRTHNWDIKRFFKQIVMSATYRQSAVETPEKKKLDPANRLLSHGPRFRMDAEMIRDYALASSGLLTPKIGGPSVRTYQPPGVWEAVAIIGSNTRDYMPDKGENLYRRSLYTFWKRSAPPASLDIFNAPSRETCTVRRERTNTPLQALVTLNDVQFVEAARFLAQRALKEGGATDAARIDFLARRLLARPFRPEEMAIVQKSLNQLMAEYKGDDKDAQALITTGDSKPDATIPPDRLAAWTMLTNQLMNLDEVLNK